MSRTYRTHLLGPFYATLLPSDEGGNQIKPIDWKQARKLLTKEQYASARTRRGDKLASKFATSSVPHWFRNETEKQYRQATRVELHRFWRLDDYDIRLHHKPDSVDWWFDY